MLTLTTTNTVAYRAVKLGPAISGKRIVRPGASIYIPADIYHSTLNTGWEPLRLLIVYSPAGPERLLRDLPGCRVLPPGITNV